ncbi:MAG: YkgJ family cysteine cluster protein [Gammaproteobacteria bacterium]
MNIETIDFFAAQAEAFAETLADRRGRTDLIDGVLSQAFSSFDGNVEIEAEAYPQIACHKGCATCCTLRVTATAPEVLLIERFLRWAKFPGRELNLAKRLEKANQATCGLGEMERVQLRKRCPFIEQGVCMIYPVRPLACRGHACYDRQACVDAARGRIDDIPISEPHRLFRGLIQNALQSSLRDAGYAWGIYELNQALSMAMNDDTCLTRWTDGQDVFEAAKIAEVSQSEMAEIFDRIKGYDSAGADSDTPVLN